jgi:hypothetical protein
MSRSTCHIGVALYTHPCFPTQWALVLSESPVFDGHVWCSTAVETVNGWGASWTPCDSSPSAFNPMALFSGVVYIAQAAMSVNHMQSVISKANVASELDRFDTGDLPYGSDKYVVLALLRLSEGRHITLPKLDSSALANFIRGRVPDLQRAQRANEYPVVSLENGRVSFGQSRR